MNDVAAREIKRLRHLGASGKTAPELIDKVAAGFSELGPGRAVNGAVHTAPASEVSVGSVHNGIDLKRCDVGLHDVQTAFDFRTER